MDAQLKKRLVGAAVLTALATIFVPMLFEEPTEQQQVRSLSLPVFPEKPTIPEVSDASTSPSEPLSVEKSGFTKPPADEASTPDEENNFSAWVIQVGIYKEQANALAVKDKLVATGFNNAAIDTPEDDKGGVMYRVRIGPELDRKRLESALTQLKQKTDLKDSYITPYLR